MGTPAHRPLTAAFPQAAPRRHEPAPKARRRLRPSARAGRAARGPPARRRCRHCGRPQPARSFDSGGFAACAQDDKKAGARPRPRRPPPRNPHPPPTACRDYVAGGRRRSIPKNSNWRPFRSVNSNPRRLPQPNSPIGGPPLHRTAEAAATHPRIARTERGSELRFREARPSGIPAHRTRGTPLATPDPTRNYPERPSIGFWPRSGRLVKVDPPERPPTGIYGRMEQTPCRRRLQRRVSPVRE